MRATAEPPVVSTALSVEVLTVLSVPTIGCAISEVPVQLSPVATGLPEIH